MTGYGKTCHLHTTINIEKYIIQLSYKTKLLRGEIFTVREEDGHSWENLHSNILVYILILPIDTAIDLQENVCGRVTNCENCECFHP